MLLDGTVLSTHNFIYPDMQSVTLSMSSLCGLQTASQSVVSQELLCLLSPYFHCRRLWRLFLHQRCIPRKQIHKVVI